MNDKSLKKLRARFDRFYSRHRQPVAEAQTSSGWFPLGLDTQIAPGWYWEADADHRYLRCGKEVMHLLGYHPEELLGKEIYSFALTPSSAQRLEGLIKAKQGIHDLKIQAKTRQGDTLPLVVNAMAHKTPSGEHLGYRGVTQILGRASRPAETFPPSLQSRDDRAYPPGASAIPPRWATIPGYQDDGQTVRPIYERPPELPTETILEPSSMQIPIRTQEGVLGMLEFDAPQGRPAWSYEDRLLAEAVAQQLAVALQDARSRELTEQALDEMREADRLKSQFLANMSHDFRTPLNSIIGFSRVILKGIDGPITETQREDLEAIYQAGQHLLNMVNDILDLTKIEAGRLRLPLSEVAPAEIIQSVMATASGLARQKPLEFVVDLPHELPPIRANQTRIRQVLLNLVSNAIKFTEEGFIMISARLLPDEQHPELLIAVSDTGSGIDPHDQEKLFEPFSQIDPLASAQPGGSGLGLSICRHIVELHGGRIWAESIPKEGSTFAFTLPIRQPVPSGPSPEPPQILAIDDDDRSIERCRSLLAEFGVQIRGLAQADEALELASSRKPSLILLDPLLPQLAGWRLLTGLKRMRETREIPVSFCTFPGQGQGFCLGTVDFLAKPVDESELMRGLRRWIPADTPSPCVLVIGDQPDELRRLCSAIESQARFQADISQTGGAALANIHRQAPNLIILDLMMAEGHAFQTLRALKEPGRASAIPILALIPSLPSQIDLARLDQGTRYLSHHRKLSEAQVTAEIKVQLAGLTAGRQGVSETKPLPPMSG